MGAWSAGCPDCGCEVFCLVVEGGRCGEDGCSVEYSGADYPAESGHRGIESEPACSRGLQPVSGDPDHGDGGDAGTRNGECDDDGGWAACAVVFGRGSAWRGGGRASRPVL